jgi:hypothetical protein
MRKWVGSMSDDIVKAHTEEEHMEYEEIFPEHIDRSKASQTIFDNAKKFLTKLYGGKRCIVCEMRGETPKDQIESHHIFEWSHWNDNDMKMVEVTLRALSPFIHGMYLIKREDILGGSHIPSLWDHPSLKNKPFTSLDDPRNQYFICRSHHQQSTDEQIEEGYDVIGIHHLPFPQWLQYLGLPSGKIPARHVNDHEDGLDRKL